jgi:putative inorganic carbon (HCO3(-)) transporter
LSLLYSGLKLTARHPIFGVGPGNFPTAHWSEALAEGTRVGWNVTHNTYLQLSSETGIPGLLLFVAFLFNAFRATRRVIKNGAANGHPELARAGYHLWLSLTGLCAAAFFLSLGYFPAFYVLGAIALSLERASARPAAQPVPLAPVVISTPGAPVAVDLPVLSSKKVMSGKEVRALMRKV